MSGDLAIYNRMRQANVPPHAIKSRLKDLKVPRFAEAIRSRGYRLGDAGLRSYLLDHAELPAAPALIAAVAAKELILLGETARVVPVPILLKSISSSDWEPQDGGYLVVPEIGENVTHWPRPDWQYAQALLMSHVSRGGGLILGYYGEDYSEFSREFELALTMFERAGA